MSNNDNNTSTNNVDIPCDVDYNSIVAAKISDELVNFSAELLYYREMLATKDIIMKHKDKQINELLRKIRKLEKTIQKLKED
jgi:hypothetical protein